MRPVCCINVFLTTLPFPKAGRGGEEGGQHRTSGILLPGLVPKAPCLTAVQAVPQTPPCYYARPHTARPSTRGSSPDRGTRVVAEGLDR